MNKPTHAGDRKKARIDDIIAQNETLTFCLHQIIIGTITNSFVTFNDNKCPLLPFSISLEKLSNV